MEEVQGLWHSRASLLQHIRKDYNAEGFLYCRVHKPKNVEPHLLVSRSSAQSIASMMDVQSEGVTTVVSCELISK